MLLRYQTQNVFLPLLLVIINFSTPVIGSENLALTIIGLAILTTFSVTIFLGGIVSFQPKESKANGPISNNVTH